MKKKLAILGASYLQLPLILKAKEMNVEIHCFAWEEGAICKDFVDFFYPISVTEKEEILKLCREINIHGITTIATDLPIPTIAYIAENLGLKSNSYESSILSTNKKLMRASFLKNNCNTPMVYKKEERLKISLPCIVKPVDRSGSRGINIVREYQFLEEAITEAIENSIIKDFIIEEYIDGNEVSVESISWNGKHKIINITDKFTTGPPRFVELAHAQPAILEEDIKNKVESECIKCLEALKITNGASHSEFKIDEVGNVKVIEVGARMGGDFIGSHLTQLSTGYDYLQSVIDVALNQFKWENHSIENSIKYSGVVYITKYSKDIFHAIERNFKNYIVKKEIFDNDYREIKNSNDRSGYIIYQSEHINIYNNAFIHSNHVI